MQRRLCKIAAWVVIVFSQLGVQGFANENSQETKQGPQLKELTFLVSTRDLSFDQNNISIVVDGISYAVHSLMRIGDQWVAKSSTRNCPGGTHPLCKSCGQCHFPNCRYYVRSCH